MVYWKYKERDLTSIFLFAVTYDEKMPETDPEALFHQKIPQVYLELQEKIQTVVVNMKKIEKPPVMRSDEFR